MVANLDLNFKAYGNRVGESHFGSNYLANRQLANQTIENGGFFQSAANAVGVTSLRYPGGTISEQYFDPADPRHFNLGNDGAITAVNFLDPNDTTQLTPLVSFLDYAVRTGRDVTIVVPTIRYFEDLVSDDPSRIAAVEKEIKDFISKALTSPGGQQITSFEIGNEFASWIAGHNTALLRHSTDFAMILRNFSVWIDEAIEEVDPVDPPSIIAQAAFVLYGDRGNNQLLVSLFDENLNDKYTYVESVADAFDAIDGVAVHSYPYTPWTNNANGTAHFLLDIENWNDWTAAFDNYADRESLDHKDLTRNVTEWNIRNLAFTSGMVSGTQGAIGMIASFATLVVAGADQMNVWPVLQVSTSTLISTSGNMMSMNFNGAAFALLRSQVTGLRAHSGESRYDIDGDGTADVLVHFFSDADRVVAFISSVQSTTLDLQLTMPNLGFDYANADVSIATLRSSANDPLALIGTPRLEVAPVDDDAVLENSLLSLALEPWTVAMVSFDSVGLENLEKSLVGSSSLMGFSFDDGLTLEERGYRNAQDGPQIVLTGSDAAENIDAVRNLFLQAGDGADTIYGTSSGDEASGGNGNDVLWGNDGDDLLFGQSGNDFLDGNTGADTLIGGDGADTLYATDEAPGDYLIGGAGDDQFYFDGAADFLDGGSGDDTFTFVGNKVFSAGYAINVGSSGQIGTNMAVSIAGYSRSAALIDGGDGYDILQLGEGNDAFFLCDEFSEVFLPGASILGQRIRLTAIEEINGGGGNDIIDLTSLYGSVGNNVERIFGGSGNDTIWGASNDEILDGGTGNDVICGGAGKDTLTGGDGADVFQFTATSAGTVVTDYDRSEGDRIAFIDGGGFLFLKETIHYGVSGLTVQMVDPTGSIIDFEIFWGS